MKTITSASNSTIAKIPFKRLEDYADLLKFYGLEYKSIYPYYHIGKITGVQGWILHLSVVRSRFLDLITTVLPVLQARNLAFKIIQSPLLISKTFEGHFGATQVGKLLTVYPEDLSQLVSLAEELASLTRQYPSPRVPTDAHLGGAVYTRYGGINPILKSGKDGTPQKYIHDHKGKLVRDEYQIPFVLPRKIPWPFSRLARSEVPKPERLLGGLYLRVDTIKSDSKGNVYKAIAGKALGSLNYCIVKEGKHFMLEDDFGRYITDKILWQVELHQELQDLEFIPRLLGSFTNTTGVHIVTEFIDGDALQSRIGEKYNNLGAWNSWPKVDKLELIDYLVQVVQAVSELHARGYIHRDIAPGNFLISKQGKVFLIDLELVYSFKRREPNPPFILGTIGYISPEQMNMSPAAFEQDVYSLGALSLLIFTALSPNQLNITNPQRLNEQLRFFLADYPLADLVSACLNDDPASRPIPDRLQNGLIAYCKQLRDDTVPEKPWNDTPAIDRQKLDETIRRGINALASPQLLDAGQLWLSVQRPHNKSIVNEQPTYAPTSGWHTGVSGILYFLSHAKLAGFDISPCQAILPRAWNFLNQVVLRQPESIPPGLFAGRAGVGLALHAAMKAGLIESLPENKAVLARLLDYTPDGVDLAAGAAGQGLAILHCSDYLNDEYISQHLPPLAARILKDQRKNGSWHLPIGDDPRNGYPVTGLAYGITGLIYFLLRYLQFSKDPLPKKAIKQGLDWLIRHAVGHENHISWPILGQGKETSIYLDQGTAGIAFLFLQAYKHFREPEFRLFAENALASIQPNIVNIHLAYDNGIAGIGETYLEAYRVLEDPVWKRRSDWITELLLQTSYWTDDGCSYWITDHDKFPTGDLFVGTTGILRYLLYARDPEHHHSLLALGD